MAHFLLSLHGDVTRTRRARSSPSTPITRFLHRTSGTGLRCVFRKPATGIRRIALARSRAHSAERGTFIAEAPTCEWWIVSEGIGFRKMTGAHPRLPMSRATRQGELTLFPPFSFSPIQICPSYRFSIRDNCIKPSSQLVTPPIMHLEPSDSNSRGLRHPTLVCFICSLMSSPLPPRQYPRFTPTGHHARRHSTSP